MADSGLQNRSATAPTVTTQSTQHCGAADGEQANRPMSHTHRDALGLPYDRLEAAVEQDGELVYLSEGSFGRITARERGVVCFKTLMSDDETGKDTLRKEFQLAWEVYTCLGRPTPDGHRFEPLPPLRFWDKSTGQQYATALEVPYGIHAVSKDGPYRPQALDDSLTATTFSMLRAPPLGDEVVQLYKQLFFGADIIGRTDHAPIRLLRLYFGRSFPPRTESLAEGLRSDLPLDVRRYERLRATYPHGAAWPTVQEISEQMGAILAVLHWGVGIDASDIELVLGGTATNGVQLFVLDYNQCTRWTDHHPVKPSSWLMALDNKDDGADRDDPSMPIRLGTGKYSADSLERIGQRLATKLHYTEYYYPRPSSDEEAYLFFRDGYIARVDMLLDQYAAPHPLQPQTVEGARAARAGVMLGAAAFVEEFERLDRVQIARRRRGSRLS